MSEASDQQPAVSTGKERQPEVGQKSSFEREQTPELAQEQAAPVKGQINAARAGRTITAEDLTPEQQEKYPDFAQKYPHGIKYSAASYPDLTPYAIAEVKFTQWQPDTLSDASLTDEERSRMKVISVSGDSADDIVARVLARRGQSLKK